MPTPNFLNPAVVQGGSSPYAQQAEAERMMGLAQAMQQQRVAPASNGFMNIISAVLPQIAGSYMAKKGERQLDASLQAQGKMAAEARAAEKAQERQWKQEEAQSLRQQRDAVAQQAGLEGRDRVLFVETGKMPNAQNQSFRDQWIAQQPPEKQAQIMGIQAGLIPRAENRAPAGPSAMQEKIALARSLGASEEDLRSMLLGGGRQQQGESALDKARAQQQAKKEAAAPIQLAALGSAETALGRIEELNRQGVGGEFEGRLAQVPGVGAMMTGNSALSAHVASLNEEVLRLTRIPGIGSQSDREGLAAAMAGISPTDPEAVTLQKIQSVKQKLGALRQAYENPQMTGAPQTGPAPQQARPAAGGATGDPLIDKYL